MLEIFEVIQWILIIAIGGLIAVGLIFLYMWVFKFLCTIQAEIIAEKVRDELEDLLERRERKEEE